MPRKAAQPSLSGWRARRRPEPRVPRSHRFRYREFIDAPTTLILGRSGELDRLHALSAGARNGRGGALLLRGDPGIGKTALLDEGTSGLPGVRVVRCDGYEAESAMPYATLQRIGRPFAEHLPALPTRQAAALRIAAGLDDGPPPDRYLVGLGMLSLLAAAGEVEPVVCVIDDAHLVDAESLEVLAFVARRLEAESIALLLGSRPDSRVDLVAAGVPVLDLAGLDTLAAVELLNRSAASPVDPYLAAQIAEETGGNPLALIDLGRDFTARQLTASSIAPVPGPVGPRLEAHYLAQVQGIPHDAQLWLLVAAAESTGDPVIIGEAAARLGLPADAAAEAERAGLVSVHDTVMFRHPLVRAAVYNGMPDADRRRVHEALRAAAAAHGRADVAVWHAAAATVGTDDAVARDLERAADAAGGRGGTASRARLLTHAADLTTVGPARDSRLLAAAEAAATAGAAKLSLDLLDRIHTDSIDPVSLGRALSLRTMLALFVADASGITQGAAVMLRAAGLFHERVPELEQRTLVRAFELALTAEWAMEETTLPELGQRLAAGADVAVGPRALALRALAAHILRPYEEAVPLMREAVAMLRESDDAQLLDLGHFGIALTMALWDERTCVELLERTARAARDAGLLRDLDTTLWLLGLIELVRGDPAASGRHIELVRELRRAIGYDAEQVVNASYLAWSGAPIEVVEQIAQAVLASGFAGAWTVAMTGLSIRSIADGHYRDAFERLQPLINRPFLQVTYQQLPDYVEAGVRSGKPDAVRAAAEQLAEMAVASGTPWVRGVAARSTAMLAPDDEAESLYSAAIEHLEQATLTGELGRAHLVYGEWLRRMKRRREAREQLRLALAIFERVDAPAFAGRARRELEATGEHVTQRTQGDAADALTPQEATIARLAAAGQTNAEIGAALFISVNTVDYHLRKVFRKLEITSRRQLAERVRSR
jgi:DNA-binding CsgD family transcriptional regulator